MRILSAMLSFVMLFSSVPVRASNLVEVARRDFTAKVEIPGWDYDGNSYIDLVAGDRVLTITSNSSATTVAKANNTSGTLLVDVLSETSEDARLYITNNDIRSDYKLVKGLNAVDLSQLNGDVLVGIENHSGSDLVITSVTSNEMDITNSKFNESIKIGGFRVTAENILVKDDVLELIDLSSETKSAVVSDKISIDGSKNSQLKVDLEVLKQSHSVEIGVNYLDATGKSLKYTNVLLKNKQGLGKVSETLELPAVAGTTDLVITFNSGGISITNAKFYGFTVSQYQEEVLVQPIEDNLLNPGFEEGLNNWKVVAENEAFTTVDTIASSGKKSLYMQDLVAEGENNTARILSNKVKVTPGKTYLASAKVNVETQSHSIVLVVEYYDSDNKVIKVHEELFSSNSLGTHQWTTIRKMSDAPSNAAYMRVGFYSGKPSVTKAYFDDVLISEVDNSQKLEREYGKPVNLGQMVNVGLGQAGAIGTNALGENEVYFISNGSPGTFYALNANTGEVKYSKVIPNTIAVWAITIGKDKNVYFGGTEDGKLYRYVPTTKVVEDLGATPADKWIWDLEVADDGKIYGTTYPNSKLFVYDPETKQHTDLGKMHDAQQYARGLFIDGDDIYVGIGTQGKHLIKYSISKGTKEEVIIEGYSGTTGTFEDLRIVGDYLFISNGTINMLVVDKNTLEVVSTFQYSNNIALPSEEDPYNIYFKFQKQFFKFNIQTLEKTEIELERELPDTVRTKDVKWVIHNGVPKIALLTQYAEYMLIEPKSGAVDFISLNVSMQAVDIQALELGFDGRLYMGGYQRGMSVYNPFTNKIDVNLPTFAQPEGIGFLNDKVWYGTYVGAIMYSYDPSKEIDLANNPNYEYKIIDEQDRPFAIESGDDKLFVGTIPDYGMHGGVLAIYDEKTDSWSQHRNVVKDQSIISLAYKDGLLYGGTSVWGGLGIDPVAKQAEMFIWDVEKDELVKSFTLDIPGIDENPRMIGNLEFGPDGLLWGAVDGTIFAFDTETETIVKSKMIQPSLYNSSKWFPYRLHFAPDGLLYTTLSRKLIAIDPETLDHKIILDDFINNMTVGIDGTIYYSQKSELFKIEVKETDATLSEIKINQETIKDFSSGKQNYELELMVDDLEEKVLYSATPTQENATYVVQISDVTTDSNSKTKEELITIVVKAEDGVSTLTYSIKVKKVLNSTDEPGDGGNIPDNPGNIPSKPGNGGSKPNKPGNGGNKPGNGGNKPLNPGNTVDDLEDVDNIPENNNNDEITPEEPGAIDKTPEEPSEENQIDNTKDFSYTPIIGVGLLIAGTLVYIFIKKRK